MARLSEGTGVNANNGIITGVLVTVGDLARVVGDLYMFLQLNIPNNYSLLLIVSCGFRSRKFEHLFALPLPFPSEFAYIGPVRFPPPHTRTYKHTPKAIVCDSGEIEL